MNGLLDLAIGNFRQVREQIKDQDEFLYEAEFIYQMISVTNELNQHLSGGYFAIDLMREKFDTLKRISESIYRENKQ